MELKKNVLEAFEQYENLKLEIKEAEEKLAELKPIIIDNIPDDKEIQAKHGIFLIQKRAVWKYSEQVKDLEIEVKELKKEEQAKGIADKEEIPTLYYKVNKK